LNSETIDKGNVNSTLSVMTSLAETPEYFDNDNLLAIDKTLDSILDFVSDMEGMTEEEKDGTMSEILCNTEAISSLKNNVK